MDVVANPMQGLLVLEPQVFADARGFLLESFRESRYAELGIREAFMQDNHSRSARNVLRGMHFTRIAQAQILTVMRGRIFDAVVDLRPASPSFGEWFGTELGDDGPRQVYMAHGFAHGFCVLSEVADLHYKVSAEYAPGTEGGLRWNDPTVGIRWPITEPIVSERDSRHPFWNEVARTLQP